MLTRIFCAASSLAKRAAQADHAVFGRRVRQVQRRALQARGRADVDQAAAALHEMWNRGRTRVPRADQVDVQHRAPLLLCGLVPGAHGQHTGVGHRGIQPTQLRDPVVDSGRQRSASRTSTTWVITRRTVLFGQPRRFGQILTCCKRVLQLRQRLADVDQDEVGALLGEPHRVAAAHPPCRAGDQDPLAGDPAWPRFVVAHSLLQKPASTGKVTPVTYLASSETR